MPRTITLLLLTLLITTGNVTARQSEREQAEQAWIATLPDPNADYGSYPDNYEAIVKKYFESRLKDPYSAVYSDFRGPAKSYRIVNVGDHIAEHGYAICVQINAKNSYGAFTGNKLAWLFIRNGVVTAGGTEDSTNFTEKVGFLSGMKHAGCPQQSTSTP